MSWIKNLIRQQFKRNVAETFLHNKIEKKGFDSIWHKLIPLNQSYPKGSNRKITRDGINYLLDISSYNSWAIFWDVTKQKMPKIKLYNLIEPNMVVFDIGAHIGETTLNMAKKAKQVYAFEAHPLTFEKLQVNVNLNHFQNIKIEKTGIGNINETQYMETPNVNNEGMNRVTSIQNSIKIDIITLDEYCLKNNIQTVDFIKIDVEGFELKVLQGGNATLRKNSPTLFIELSDKPLKAQGTSANEIINYLHSCDYTNIIDIRTGEKIDNSQDLTEIHTDILCKK